LVTVEEGVRHVVEGVAHASEPGSSSGEAHGRAGDGPGTNRRGASFRTTGCGSSGGFGCSGSATAESRRDRAGAGGDSSGNSLHAETDRESLSNLAG